MCGVWCVRVTHQGLPSRAELVPLWIPHHPPAARRPLINKLHTRRPELFQPHEQSIKITSIVMHVDVQPVLGTLLLGHGLEQDPASLTDSAHRVEGIIRVPDRGEPREPSPAAVFDDRGQRELSGRDELRDERAGILDLILQRQCPEVSERVRIPTIDDKFPVQCHGHILCAG